MAATKQTLGLLCCLYPFTLSGTLLWHYLIIANRPSEVYEPDFLNDKTKNQLAWPYQDFVVNNTQLVMPMLVAADVPPGFNDLNHLTQFLKEQSSHWKNTEIDSIKNLLPILTAFPNLLSALNIFLASYTQDGKLVTQKKKEQYRTVIHLLSISTAIYTWLESLANDKIVELLEQFMNNPMAITEIGLAFSEDEDESLLALLSSFPFLWPLISNHLLSGIENYRAVFATVNGNPSLKKNFAEGTSYFALTVLFHKHRDIFGINHSFKGLGLYNLAQEYLAPRISKYKSTYGSFPIIPEGDMIYTMINIMISHPELYYAARGFPVPQNMPQSLSCFFYTMEQALQKEPQHFQTVGSHSQEAGAQLVKYFEYPELLLVLNWLAEIKGPDLMKYLWAIPPENLYALLVAPVSMTEALYGLSMLSFPLVFPQSKTYNNLKIYLFNVLSSYYKSGVEKHSERLAALLLKWRLFLKIRITKREKL